MNVSKISMILIVVCGVLSFSLEGAETPPATNQPNDKTQDKVSAPKGNGSSTQQKFDIMERDEMEDTDTLAIPFDDSEVEDEEEINRAEKKEVFSLPSKK